MKNQMILNSPKNCKIKKNQLEDDSKKRGSFMSNAFKLGTELVAAVAVGTIIGFILDTWFDTKPG